MSEFKALILAVAAIMLPQGVRAAEPKDQNEITAPDLWIKNPDGSRFVPNSGNNKEEAPKNSDDLWIVDQNGIRIDPNSQGEKTYKNLKSPEYIKYEK